MMMPGRCACGSPFPHFRVEGRTDEILSVQAADGTQVKLLPLALETVVEETPGLRRFQLIQTGPRTPSLRLEAEPNVDAAMVLPEERFCADRISLLRVREHEDHVVAKGGPSVQGAH